MKLMTAGETLAGMHLLSIKDQSVTIPHAETITHLQFRRFAGCPICNLHLQSFFRRADELQANGVHEVIVFHASKEAMLENVVDVPFDLIADPSRKLYRQFGVEGSWKALCNLRALGKGIKGMGKFGMKTPQSLEAELGLPADFLIDTTGKVVAVKYGRHADDQWSVDEVLEMAKGDSV